MSEIDIAKIRLEIFMALLATGDFSDVDDVIEEAVRVEDYVINGYDE